MKYKILQALPTSLFLFLVLVGSAHAQINLNPVPDDPTETGSSPLLIIGNVNVANVIQFVVIALVVVGVLAALIWLIIGAIKWIISGGDKDKVAAARGQIIAAIIGLVVLLLAVVIINFIIGLVNPGSNLFNLQLPTLKDQITKGT